MCEGGMTKIHLPQSSASSQKNSGPFAPFVATNLSPLTRSAQATAFNLSVQNWDF
jgi:hypothetical protein